MDDATEHDELQGPVGLADDEERGEAVEGVDIPRRRQRDNPSVPSGSRVLGFVLMLVVAGCADDDATGGTDSDNTTGAETSTETSTGETIATVTTNVGGSASSEGTGGDDGGGGGAEHEPAQTEPPQIGALFAWDSAANEWITDPSTQTVPGPLSLRVDAWAGDLERVEFSVDHELPFVVASPVDDGRYFATIPLDHTMWEGARTFIARAIDTQGRSAETTLSVDVDFLYPSGYPEFVAGAKNVTGHIVWSDTVSDSDGSIWIVGYEEEEGEIPRMLVEHRAADGEVIASDFAPPAFGQPTYGRRIVVHAGAAYVLASFTNKDIVVRYQANGEIAAVWAPSGVELHDLAVTNDNVIVVGNSGELGQTEALLTSWWLSNALVPQWEHQAAGDGNQKNSARRAKLIGGDLFIVGFVELSGQRAGYIGSHNPVTGERSWSATLYEDSEEEEIADIAGTPDAIVTIGTAKTADGVLPRLRKIGWGQTVHDIDNLEHTESAGLMIESAPGYEVVIGARTCTLEPKCAAVFRRYGWGWTPYPKLIWHDQTDGATPTALEAAQWGFTNRIYTASVNLGQGHHILSSLDRYHP